MKSSSNGFPSDIVQVLLSHLFGLTFALLISFALASMSKNKFGLIISAALALIAYSIPCIIKLWNMGHQHSNFAKRKMHRIDQLYGFKISLISNIPFFLLGVILFASKLGVFNLSIVLYKLINPQLWAIINIIEPSGHIAEFTLFEAIFVGFVLPLIPVLIQGVSYILGAKNIVFIENLVYKIK